MSSKSEKNIGIAFALNFCFSIIELVGGLLTNSVSIISDSIHDFGDCLSILISWVLEKKSEKKPDRFYTYGYQKFSVLGAMINALVLIFGALIIFISALPRIFRSQFVNYDGVLFLSILGLFVNGLGAYKTISGEKINEKVVGLHLLEDVLSWAAVLFTALLMKIFDLPILDPILSIFIASFILFNAGKSLKKIFEIFLDKSPNTLNLEMLKKELVDGKRVLDIHHFHLRTDGVNSFLTFHLVINDLLNRDDIIEIKKNISYKLVDKKIAHFTIEFEFKSENCNEYECKNVKNSIDLHLNHHH